MRACVLPTPRTISNALLWFRPASSPPRSAHVGDRRPPELGPGSVARPDPSGSRHPRGVSMTLRSPCCGPRFRGAERADEVDWTSEPARTGTLASGPSGASDCAIDRGRGRGQSSRGCGCISCVGCRPPRCCAGLGDDDSVKGGRAIAEAKFMTPRKPPPVGSTAHLPNSTAFAFPCDAQ